MEILAQNWHDECRKNPGIPTNWTCTHDGFFFSPKKFCEPKKPVVKVHPRGTDVAACEGLGLCKGFNYGNSACTSIRARCYICVYGIICIYGLPFASVSLIQPWCRFGLIWLHFGPILYRFGVILGYIYFPKMATVHGVLFQDPTWVPLDCAFRESTLFHLSNLKKCGEKPVRTPFGKNCFACTIFRHFAHPIYDLGTFFFLLGTPQP